MDFIGRTPEQLSNPDQWKIAGRWAAFELYSPETNPFRLIQALGDSPADCIRQLQSRGLDPKKYEFVILKPPLPR